MQQIYEAGSGSQLMQQLRSSSSCNQSGDHLHVGVQRLEWKPLACGTVSLASSLDWVACWFLENDKSCHFSWSQFRLLYNEVVELSLIVKVPFWAFTYSITFHKAVDPGSSVSRLNTIPLAPDCPFFNCSFEAQCQYLCDIVMMYIIRYIFGLLILGMELLLKPLEFPIKLSFLC